MENFVERVLGHPRWRWVAHLVIPLAAMAVLFSGLIVAEALDTEQKIATARCTSLPNLTNTGFGSGISVGQDNQVYALEAQARCVVRIDSTGTGAVVAGVPGTPECPACKADLGVPFDLAVDADGVLFIGDQTTAHLRIIRPDGSTRSIEANYDDFVRPAVQAFAVDPAGVLYIAEQDKVRRYEDGAETLVVAGGGESDINSEEPGDIGPARSVRLGGVSAMAVGPDGSLYLVQEGRFRVLKVDPEGQISLLAGSGQPGEAGDGGPATSAKVDATGVAVDDAGNVYVAIQNSHRIRRIDSAGRITTIAGTGGRGPTGDGGPATQALLNYPSDLAWGGGILYVLDGDRIRRIDKAGIITTVGPKL